MLSITLLVVSSMKGTRVGLYTREQTQMYLQMRMRLNLDMQAITQADTHIHIGAQISARVYRKSTRTLDEAEKLSDEILHVD